MNKSLDAQLTTIQGLKWLPFIGTNFPELSNHKRVLILGESHYRKDTDADLFRFEHPDTTRELHEEIGIDLDSESYGVKVYYNLYKALFDTDDINAPHLWQFLVYHNLVQRPMITSKERPSREDFIKGWDVLFKINEILQPSVCLCIGTSSFPYLKEYLSTRPEFVMRDSFYDMIGSTIPRIAEVETRKGIIKFIFIKHTSMYFSPSKWNEFLHDHMKEQIDWLKEFAFSKVEIEE